MKLYAWDQMEQEQLNPTLGRRAIHSANLTIARLELQQHAKVPEHSHVHEQVCMVQSGALKFRFPDREQIVRAGEALVIASNEPHAAEALEDTVAVDVFSPPREDWIQGDDAYLRK